jgi:hypothetical protein
VLNDKEAVQQLERQRRHSEEIERNNRLAVILQECQPLLGGAGLADSARRSVQRRRSRASATRRESSALPSPDSRPPSVESAPVSPL